MRRVLVAVAIYSAVLASSASVTLGQQPPAAPPAQDPAAAVPPPPAAAARGPQAAPKNLKVLPKEWTTQQVRALMQTFAESLGVMCTHCHAPDPNAPPPAAGRPPTLDYSLDEKPEKEVARKMIQMVMSVNSDALKGIGDQAIPEKVSCFTCHAGAKVPLTQPAAGWGRGGFSLLPAGPPARGRGANP
ncbi:MAG: c-type cytochrome [Acidobacteriota bacterium]